MQDFRVIQEFDDITDFKHREINQHTSYLWCQFRSAGVFLYQREQQFSQNGSLFLHREIRELRQFLLELGNGESLRDYLLHHRCLHWDLVHLLLLFMRFLIGLLLLISSAAASLASILIGRAIAVRLGWSSSLINKLSQRVYKLRQYLILGSVAATFMRWGTVVPGWHGWG